MSTPKRWTRAAATAVVLVVSGCASASGSSAASTASTAQPGATSPTADAVPHPVTTTWTDPTQAEATTSTALGQQETDAAITSAMPAPGIYANATAGQLSPAVADAKQYVYVPSNENGSVTVIDQASMQIVDEFHVGKLAQHVVTDWGLGRLYATVSGSNQLVPIDPATGRRAGVPIHVAAPYNLYFTPDGSTAVVMAERLDRIDYYDRSSWRLLRSVATKPCHGINHADWSPDGSWFLATCEFSGGLVKVDTATGQIIGRLDLEPGSMPQDLRLAPDGTKFYVADMAHECVWVIDATGTNVVESIITGTGAHGIYPSRDATRIYVSNRGRIDGRNTGPSRQGQGSVSVIDPTTDQVVDTWQIPGGGSPDMGGVSADGTRLWLAGRYDAVVYVFDTATGELFGRISVPPGPHGLNVFPQPGQYSLGHTGNYR